MGRHIYAYRDGGIGDVRGPLDVAQGRYATNKSIGHLRLGMWVARHAQTLTARPMGRGTIVGYA